ncbi:hypothetical protein [Vulcanisaeta souniana]|uniref:Uncharacterized protein n=1 Tax=Vulcanisaeta souniana JCM 11219 TaxID=1293586 RepID=A0A830E3M2_9CREN|nr:hypothetical protein [Vulcanisaeta souniana]BDR93006.1 hypothetical protein Vsou_20990 [Vulcanisaeta souniana JCM 11219]GGI83612.1 hypothetical protein GCM10007112_20530 [Vulcanisaeta souniana JCM 11219]
MSTLNINPLIYRFVRYCLNRTYLDIDDNKLSADERYSLETILAIIRQAEDNWEGIDDVVKFISEELPKIYGQALERLPDRIVDELFEKMLNNCKELDEVKSNSKVLNAINDAFNEMKNVKKKFLEGSKTRIYEPSA